MRRRREKKMAEKLSEVDDLKLEAQFQKAVGGLEEDFWRADVGA